MARVTRSFKKRARSHVRAWLGAGVVIVKGKVATKKRAGVRKLAIAVHRYVGLAMALFLIVAGITGSLLAFYAELDRAINPQLMRAAPTPAAPALLDPFELNARVNAQLPAGQRYWTVHFAAEADKAVSGWVNVAKGRSRELFADPYTGAVLGSRDWGDLAEGKRNLMPFVYRLHYSLALGEVGIWLFGIVALLWTVDCFVGAYLTFPPASKRAADGGARASWLKRWLPAWQLRTNKLFAFVFTWHRASGLWVWALLLVFAWSAVGLNLPCVYEPAMRIFGGLAPHVHEQLPELEPPYREPTLSLRRAHDVGRRLLATEAQRRHFTVISERSLSYLEEHGAYVYSAASSLEISSKYPRTSVYFDAHDGHLIGFEADSGMGFASTLTSWLYALHFAAVFGLGYRVFVTLMGVLVALLSVTGVWIWWRKRSKRQARESA